MDIIGRVLEDWIMFEEPAYEDDEYLQQLINITIERVGNLPRKFQLEIFRNKSANLND